MSKAEASEQLERFKEAARALGCDEDEATFRAKLAVIAQQKPKAEPAPPGPVKPKRKPKGA